MSRFDYCLKVVLNHEGGVSNDKHDHGGLTNYGVTQKVYDDFCKVTGREQKPVTEIAMNEVEAIYGGYWKDASCSYMPDPLDLLVFDCAVNSGAGRAIKMLQDVLGVDADGICGKQTLAALHDDIVAIGLHEICTMYLDNREAFYVSIVQKNPTQKKFLQGWLNRADHLRELTCG